MSNDWRKNNITPIYKNKKDIQNCANYIGIELMTYTIKLWEQAIENNYGVKLIYRRINFVSCQLHRQFIYYMGC